MRMDENVIKSQIINQVELAYAYLNTSDEYYIFQFVKSHIIYPGGTIMDVPMADIDCFGDDFIMDVISDVINNGGESTMQSSRWTDKNRWE